MRARFVRGADSKKSLNVGKNRTWQVGDKAKLLFPDYYAHRRAQSKWYREQGYGLTDRTRKSQMMMDHIEKNFPDAEFEIIKVQGDSYEEGNLWVSLFVPDELMPPGYDPHIFREVSTINVNPKYIY